MMRSAGVTLFVVVAILRLTTPAPAPAAAQRMDDGAPPNIVIILSDDMGFSDIGCYGGEIPTPNIDRLAENGLRFSQFYNTGRCCPTRASLLTGLYPHQAGMGWMTGQVTDHPGYSGELSHGAVTLAEALKPAGYSAYMAGKWHVTSRMKPGGPKDNWPLQRGFDRFYGTAAGGNHFDPAMLVRDNTPIAPDSDPEYRPTKPYYYTDAIADQSARFIREHGGSKPFFLYVAFTAPHWPLHALEETIAKYRGKYDGGYEPVRRARLERMKELGIIPPGAQLSPAPLKWDAQPDTEWEARCMEVYAAQVDHMDRGIGKIAAALEARGAMENTLILYLHDNGASAENIGRPGTPRRQQAQRIEPMAPGHIQTVGRPLHTRAGEPIRDGRQTIPGPPTSYIAYGEGWANVSNTPLRGYKIDVHEGGISTPLVAHWPKGIQRKGAIEHQPGHLVDVMATCIEISGASYPAERAGRAIEPMQGVSLMRAFRGEPLQRSEPLFFEHKGNRAIRDGKWKLVASGAEGPWELYDIEADRSEMRDLAPEHPGRVKSMAEAWQTWAEANQVLPLVPWEKQGAGGGGE